MTTLLLMFAIILGGTFLGALIPLGQKTDPCRQGNAVLGLAMLILRIALLALGFYLLAGFHVAYLLLCLLGFGLAQFEMRGLRQPNPAQQASMA